MLPRFDAADWPQFVTRFGLSVRRQRLLAGQEAALRSLRDAGCRLACVDGSFVTAKREPGDFGACWTLAGVDTSRLDPVLLDCGGGRAAQKSK